MRFWIPFLMAVAVVSGPLAPPSRADESDLAQALIESASTPEQHAALAKHYEEKAAEARAEAARHLRMAKAYRGGKQMNAVHMRAHCEKLAALFEEQAKELEEMAGMHRDLAK